MKKEIPQFNKLRPRPYKSKHDFTDHVYDTPIITDVDYLSEHMECGPIYYYGACVPAMFMSFGTFASIYKGLDPKKYKWDDPIYKRATDATRYLVIRGTILHPLFKAKVKYFHRGKWVDTKAYHGVYVREEAIKYLKFLHYIRRNRMKMFKGNDLYQIMNKEVIDIRREYIKKYFYETHRKVFNYV